MTTAYNISSRTLENGHATGSGQHDKREGGGLQAHIMDDVDTTQCGLPLTGYFLMSGYLSGVSFSATFVWSGFMTGNWAQLATALPRLFEGTVGLDRDLSFRLADQQALVCLLTFFLGVLFGRRPVNRLFGGPTSRLWLVVGTAFQAICTAVSAVLIWQSNSDNIAVDSRHGAWKNLMTFIALGIMSFTMGLQGAMARALNTPFGATVVLTSTFVELFSDPKLFYICQRVPTRDSKLAGSLALGIGAFAARAMMYEVGDGETLGIAAALRLLVALAWVFVPGIKRSVEPEAPPTTAVPQLSMEYSRRSTRTLTLSCDSCHQTISRESDELNKHEQGPERHSSDSDDGAVREKGGGTSSSSSAFLKVKTMKVEDKKVDD